MEEMMQTLSLRSVHQGMKVFDVGQHEIGKVDWIKFGEDDPETPEVESADIDRTAERRDSLIDNIAEVFSPAELPEEVRQRLLQQGFVRVDTSGLFASDRYVLPDQIASISSDGVMLKVDKDELIKEP
jgi:hypothetical protein